MRLRQLFLLLFFISISTFVQAQKSDLSKMAYQIKTNLIATYEESGMKISQGTTGVPIVLDGDPVNFEMLDEYSLSDIAEIKLVFDKKVTFLYGSTAINGMIFITKKEEVPPEKK